MTTVIIKCTGGSETEIAALITRELPASLHETSTLAAFKPLSSDVNITDDEILKILSKKELEVKIPQALTEANNQDSHILFLNPLHVRLYEENKAQFNQLKSSRKAQDQKALPEVERNFWKYKYLVIGAVFHWLGHYVYSELQTREAATHFQIGTQSLSISKMRMVSLIEETPVAVSRSAQAALREQEERKRRGTPLIIAVSKVDPGHVVELGVFGFVGNFFTVRDGSHINDFLFRHHDEIEGVDLTPIPSREIFRTMLTNFPQIVKIDKDNLQDGGEVDVVYKGFPYRRVGFDVLCGVPAPERVFGPKSGEEAATLMPRRRPRGWKS